MKMTRKGWFQSVLGLFATGAVTKAAPSKSAEAPKTSNKIVHNPHFCEHRMYDDAPCGARAAGEEIRTTIYSDTERDGAITHYCEKHLKERGLHEGWNTTVYRDGKKVAEIVDGDLKIYDPNCGLVKVG